MRFFAQVVLLLWTGCGRIASSSKPNLDVTLDKHVDATPLHEMNGHVTVFQFLNEPLLISI